jgi:hypothetical protein
MLDFFVLSFRMMCSWLDGLPRKFLKNYGEIGKINPWEISLISWTFQGLVLPCGGKYQIAKQQSTAGQSWGRDTKIEAMLAKHCLSGCAD